MHMLFVSYLDSSSEQIMLTISAVAPVLTGLQLITNAFMLSPLQRVIHRLIKALRGIPNNKQTAMQVSPNQQNTPILLLFVFFKDLHKYINIIAVVFLETALLIDMECTGIVSENSQIYAF